MSWLTRRLSLMYTHFLLFFVAVFSPRECARLHLLSLAKAMGLNLEEVAEAIDDYIEKTEKNFK